MTQYLGLDVLELAADGGAPQGDEQERHFYMIDPGTGKRSFDDPEAVSAGVAGYAWVCTALEEISALKSFLDGRRGRAVPFWLPTFRDELSLAQDAAAVDTSIDIAWMGYAANLWPDTGARRHLFIRLESGALIYRKATAATNNGDGTETIDLDSALGSDAPAATSLVGFLRLCRLDEDQTRIEHVLGGAGTRRFSRATLSIRELPKEASL